jgi:hypothetical protein
MSQRLALFDMYRDRPGVPVTLNLLLGFGVGSAVQGNMPGFVGGLLSDIAGFGFIAAHMMPSQMGDTRPFLVTGLAFLGVSRIVQIFLPLHHSATYNRVLNDALIPTRLIIEPGVTSQGNASFTAGISFNF